MPRIRRIAKKKKPMLKKRVLRRTRYVRPRGNDLSQPERTGVFGGKRFFKLKYNLTGASSAVVFDDSVMRLNSLFDPEYTAGGHQPYGYDQLGTFFTRYNVYGVKIQGFLTGGVGAVPMNVIFHGDDQAGTMQTSDINRLREMKGNRCYTVNSSDKAKQVNMYFDNSKIFGVSKTVFMNERDYGHTFATNPSIVSYLHILPSSTTGALVASGVSWNLVLTYYCKMHEPIEFAAS